MRNNLLVKQIILLITLIGFVSSAAYADRRQDREDRRDNHRSFSSERKYDRDYRRDRFTRVQHVPEGYRLDKRYRSDRYYPRPGYRVKVLPQRHYVIRYHDRPYYYSSGIWYGRTGGVFVVTAPPLGVVVPVLPPFYTTLWLGGIAYYYANDVYYTWQPERNGYVVTNPPANLQQEDLVPQTDKLFIYPKKGQSAQQQANDKYECHRWGVKQTGYDPSQPPDNMTQDTLAQKRIAYQNAMKACLEGRGYSVE